MPSSNLLPVCFGRLSRTGSSAGCAERAPGARFRARAVAVLLLACAGPLAAAPPEREAFNVNTADAATIARNIKGIGLKRAEQIVAYRKEHGPFTDAYELMAIKGIGERIIRNNESRILLRDR